MTGGFNDIISGYPEEDRGMGDLAQAIVALGRSAERRRGARAELIEATDTIAKAIRDQLRAGDEVQVRMQTAEGQTTTGVIHRPTVTYEAARANKSGLVFANWEDVLLRGDAILGLPEAQGPYDIEGWNRPKAAGHPATADERERFVLEAEAVVKAFRELMDKNAETYKATARKAAKLTPR